MSQEGSEISVTRLLRIPYFCRFYIRMGQFILLSFLSNVLINWQYSSLPQLYQLSISLNLLSATCMATGSSDFSTMLPTKLCKLLTFMLLSYFQFIQKQRCSKLQIIFIFISLFYEASIFSTCCSIVMMRLSASADSFGFIQSRGLKKQVGYSIQYEMFDTNLNRLLQCRQLIFLVSNATVRALNREGNESMSCGRLSSRGSLVMVANAFDNNSGYCAVEPNLASNQTNLIKSLWRMAYTMNQLFNQHNFDSNMSEEGNSSLLSTNSINSLCLHINTTANYKLAWAISSTKYYIFKFLIAQSIISQLSTTLLFL